MDGAEGRNMKGRSWALAGEDAATCEDAHRVATRFNWDEQRPPARAAVAYVLY